MTRLMKAVRARGLGIALLCAVTLGATACADTSGTVSVAGGTPQPFPTFDHIIVVVEENHSFADIIGASDAPYINTLASRGAVFTDSHAVTHPSQPNYLALFAGSTFGVTSDDCPQSFTSPNLGAELLASGRSFVGYSESLPAAGETTCFSGGPSDPSYARKHNPWVNFADVPAASNLPFTAFPSDFASLPSLAFVVPNEQHDMHSASVADGDGWLQQHMDAYIQWATTHNSLLILTWDEDDNTSANQIPTLFVGAHVRAGRYAETITHYNVLRTIETLESVPFTGAAANVSAIADIWQA